MLRVGHTDATVKFMVQALHRAGCPVDRRFFSVESCTQEVVGGFRPGDGVRGERLLRLLSRAVCAHALLAAPRL